MATHMLIVELNTIMLPPNIGLVLLVIDVRVDYLARLHSGFVYSFP